MNLRAMEPRERTLSASGDHVGVDLVAVGYLGVEGVEVAVDVAGPFGFGGAGGGFFEFESGGFGVGHWVLLCEQLISR